MPYPKRKSPKWTRIRQIMDGTVDVPTSEFDTFIKKVVYHQYKGQYSICIPIQIARKLQLNKDDVLLVAIRHATKEDVSNFTVIERKKKL